jgi:8-amino-7-oxononanoate synthase
MGTFSKSLASVGGVIAGSASVIHWLRHHSRALIFTASMPPASVAGVLAALDVMRDEPDRRTRLWANTHRVAEGIRSLGFEVGATQTPIIPVVIGELGPRLQLWRALFDEGVFTHPIVPPAVPATSCRLRVSMSAEHSDEQVERVLSAFARVARSVRPSEATEESSVPAP